MVIKSFQKWEMKFATTTRSKIAHLSAILSTANMAVRNFDIKRIYFSESVFNNHIGEMF
jgi:hypothetical protein